jgi:putative flavoprotein involved in K+ transport
MKTTGTVIIGAGQAGLALSHYLSRARFDHVVLDRGRIGERWRSERWESLRLLTPNWLNRLPGSAPHADRNGFLSGSAFARYLEGYARSFSAPLQEGVSVLEVASAKRGFTVDTDSETWRATNVVIATGYADQPRLPAVAPAAPARIVQLHSSRYRSADRLPPGGVLIVGSGPSGQQLAAELRRSGRDVTLAVGRHARSPRRYRGSDIWAWFARTGRLDQTLEDVPYERDPALSPSLVLSGAHGGEHLDLATLSALGVVVTGRLKGFNGRYAVFADDLEPTVREADEKMSRMLARIDRRIAEAGSDDPPAAEPIPVQTLPRAPRVLDLEHANVSTLIWATGYRRSYPWLNVDVLDAEGEIANCRGVTAVRGLYALGLRFQHRRKSHFIGGVGDDAGFIAAGMLAPAAHARQRRPAVRSGSHDSRPLTAC